MLKFILLRLSCLSSYHVTLILDKISKKESIELLIPIIKSPGVTSILVVEQRDYKNWGVLNREEDIDKNIYVPRIWGIAKLFLPLLLKKNNQTVTETYLNLLIDYLDFKNQGVPGEFITQLSRFYKNNPPRLLINQEDSSEILYFGQKLSHLGVSNAEIFDTIGISTLFNKDEEEKEKKRVDFYRALDGVLKNFYEGKEDQQETVFIAELKSSDFSESTKHLNDLATKIFERLDNSDVEKNVQIIKPPQTVDPPPKDTKLKWVCFCSLLTLIGSCFLISILVVIFLWLFGDSILRILGFQ